jgi:Flp pilus assembly protein TadG
MKSVTVIRLVRDRSGAAAIEAGLLLPLLFGLVFGAIEIGRLAWTRNALEFAVSEAARCAVIGSAPCDTSAGVAAYAATRISATDVPASAFTHETADCGARVRASFAHRFIIHGLSPAAPVLTAEVCRS